MTGTLSAHAVADLLGQPPPTKEQADVIEAPLEPLLVVAGAGSGKTETMASRVVWLVANGFVAPDRVLGLTFTRKAAGELADRVRLRLRQLVAAGVVPALPGTELAEPVVATYHSYAASVVADHGLRLGIEPGSRLLGEAASWQLAQEVVEGWDADLVETGRAPGTVVDALVALSAECAEHLVEPASLDDYLTRVLDAVARLPKDDSGGAPAAPTPSSESGKVVAALAARRRMVPLLEAYVRRKRDLDALDFGDQIALAARLAQQVPDVGAGERARFDVVLLDEYQDTSHAQLVLLRQLFGGGHPVTAVGDPNQSIYGWRGASAGNLDRFGTDFARSDGSTARVAWLSTSWRNDTRILDVANALADELRAGSAVEVKPLSAKENAGPGSVSARWFTTVDEESEAMAQELARLWRAEDRDVAEGKPRSSMAVLCRKRSQFLGVEQALRAAGLPVEVVGLGGLLDRPEVLDVVSTLQVLHDPTRGDALVRLLTGPRWRIGPRDLEALGEWARELHRRAAPRRDLALRAPVVDPDEVDGSSLVDALDALPGRGWRGSTGRGFSDAGRERLAALAAELSRLRRRSSLPLPELVVEIERALMLDVELAAVPGVTPSAARAQLDAFLDVAAGFAESADRPTLGGFLSWLDAAAEKERGLSQAEEVEDTSLAPEALEPSRSAVQVMTVHAAKGLEWDVVAVPGLVEGAFPGVNQSQQQDTDAGWLSGIDALPYPLRGDAASLPVWHWPSAAHLAELTSSITRFKRECGAHAEREERRLAYVAATRARHHLWLSGAWWQEGKNPRTPSRYLREVADRDARWVAEEPPEGPNPRLAEPRRVAWPFDPLGVRRPVVEAAAAQVETELEALSGKLFELAGEPDPDGWADEVDRLLAERDSATRPDRDVLLPVHLSASRVVQLAADPGRLAEQLRRPMPAEPRPPTRRGTAFHAWLEERFRAESLVDLLDLPGAGDDDAAPDAELPKLQEVFLASEWAHRNPVAVEVDVETPVADVVIRGRIDAVFRREDGGFDVVDWKTGRPPTGAARQAAAVQLAVYRLAWSRLHAVPLETVGAAFFYASTGETVRPADDLDEAALVALLTSLPAARP